MVDKHRLPLSAQHLNEKAAAEVIGVAYRTLQDWRLAGCGPAYRRLGRRRIFYVLSDLIAWSDSCRHQNTSAERVAV